MILILFAWLYCFVLCLALGAGALKIISRFSGAENIRYEIFYQFWFGFAILIALLQLLSIFFPVNVAVFVMISLLAFLSAALDFRSAFDRAVRIYRRLTTLRGILSLVIVCILLVIISYCANHYVTHTDTFIYHFNAVKWAREYPAVPGLVNLHPRLGFNSSFFLFAAFTEIGVYANHSAQIALSFLLAVCVVQWFLIVSDKNELMAKRIFCLITFPFLYIHIEYRMDIASLATDYPMAVLMLIFCLALLDQLKNKILLLVVLAAVVFTFKLSGMLIVAIAVALLAGYWLKYRNVNTVNRKADLRLLIFASALMGFILLGFIVRNIITSGWLVYPFPVGNLHLPWSVSKEYVVDMIDVIKSYPKLPGGASPEQIRIGGFLYWFNPWFNNFKGSIEFYFLVASSIIMLWSVYHVPSFRKFIYARLNILLLCLFSILSIMLWFTSAPDKRFGSIYFYILLAGAVLLLFESTKNKNILKPLIYSWFIYQVVSYSPAFFIDKEAKLFSLAYTKDPKVVRVLASPPDQQPPLYIYMPAEGNQCGNAPLPCTPYAGGLLHVHQNIRERVPGDLSKGFLRIQTNQ